MEMTIISFIPILVIIVIYFTRSQFKRETVYDYERALKYTKGELVDVLGPGRYLYMPAYTRFKTVDTRPRYNTVTGQEILTSDSISIKMSLALSYEIIDPVRAYNEVQNYWEGMYLELQIALREIVGSASIEEVLEMRTEFGAKLMGMVSVKAAELGLKLLVVEVKDIMFPGALKQTFAQVAAARQEGLAAVERARGESAALRSLTNASKMLEKNPALMQLRLIQALGESKENTLVLNLSSEGGLSNALTSGEKGTT